MRKQIDQELMRIHAADEGERRCTIGWDASTRRWLTSRRDARLIVSPWPGLYARVEYWEGLSPAQRSLHIVRALALLHPDWVFCFTSAAAVHGLEVAHTLTGEVHVLSSHAGIRSGVSYHAYPVKAEDIECVDGVRVTSTLRTVFDCARNMSFPFGLAVADSALRHTGQSSTVLKDYVDSRGKGCRGVARARVVARRANPLSENGGESYARAVMLENGVREPELQVPFDDWMNPGRSFRVDYLWRMQNGLDVAGELDGKGKIENALLLQGVDSVEALRAERQRESRLTSSLRVARFTYPQVRAITPFLRILDAYGIPMDEKPDGVLRPYQHVTAKDRYVHLR